MNQEIPVKPHDRLNRAGHRALHSLIVNVLLFYTHVRMLVDVMCAGDTTDVIDQSINRPSKGLNNDLECLHSVINYYPSGSRIRQGSTVDRVVERARSWAVAKIIDDLRKPTGKDLGDDPQNWLKTLYR